jgi:hypothetical protein
MISQLQMSAVTVLSKRLQRDAAKLIQKALKKLLVCLATKDKHKQTRLLQLSYELSGRDARSSTLSLDRRLNKLEFRLEKILCIV